MSNALDPTLQSRIDEIDYVVAQFPGGGARGYAEILKLAFFEEVTGIPTCLLFPHVAASSVGTTPLAALYLHHHKNPSAPLMSARQLLDIFPQIAARLPENIPLFKKTDEAINPLMGAITTLINGAKLKDFLGSVSISTHRIEGGANSFVAFEKLVDPASGNATYPNSNPDMLVTNMVRMSIALPVIFTPHDDHIDLAFTQSPDTFFLKISKMFPDKKGGCVYVGNFRKDHQNDTEQLHRGGVFRTIFAAIDQIDNGTWSQTIKFTRELFDGRVFNLEEEISRDMVNPPSVTANVATPEQFEKIREMTGKYIEDNKEVLTALAMRLKTLAEERIENNPALAFGIAPRIQEFPLPEIPAMPKKESNLKATWNLVNYGASLAVEFSRQFNAAARQTAKYISPKASAFFQTIAEKQATQQAGETLRHAMQSAITGLKIFASVCLPNSSPPPNNAPEETRALNRE